MISLNQIQFLHRTSSGFSDRDVVSFPKLDFSKIDVSSFSHFLQLQPTLRYGRHQPSRLAYLATLVGSGLVVWSRLLICGGAKWPSWCPHQSHIAPTRLVTKRPLPKNSLHVQPHDPVYGLLGAKGHSTGRGAP